MTFTASALIERARNEARVEDLGDSSLSERLADLVGQLDARLDDEGRARATQVIGKLLVERLRLLEARRQLPIAEEQIRRPIIAMGEARSGTTVLQMLLGCDQDSRLLEFWEVMRPTSPPSESDRRRLGDDDWREILQLVPKWLVSHPYNAMLGRNPPECERTWALDFRSLPPSAWWRVPGVFFPRIQLPRDDVRQLEIHRMFLQQLQYGVPTRRWVLKGITHQLRLPALMEAYPDALLVWIHRDPLQAIASKFELQAQIYESLSGSINRRAFAADVVQQSVANFTAFAHDPHAVDPRIRHLTYHEFTRDPIAAVRALYDEWELEFTDSFEMAMGDWVADNPAHRYGRFEYSVDALGVDVPALDRQLDPYRERFGLS